MYLARDTGIFERNGLKITWTNPGSNDKLLAGLKKGRCRYRRCQRQPRRPQQRVRRSADALGRKHRL